MPLKLPPTHRADATPVLIWERQEGAWKDAEYEAEKEEVARINEERKAAADKDGREPELLDIKRHPIAIYRSGETRFDLTAPILWRGRQVTVLDWVTEEATRFKLRRLRWRQWYDLMSKPVVDQALAACEMGIEAVENGPSALAIPPDATRTPDAVMQTLWEIDPQLPVRIGLAVIDASRPLNDGEKKP